VSVKKRYKRLLLLFSERARAKEQPPGLEMENIDVGEPNIDYRCLENINLRLRIEHILITELNVVNCLKNA